MSEAEEEDVGDIFLGLNFTFGVTTAEMTDRARLSA